MGVDLHLLQILFQGPAIFAEDSSLCRTFTNSMSNFRRHRLSIKHALYMSDGQNSFCSSCASPSRAGNFALPQPQAGPARAGIANSIRHYQKHYLYQTFHLSSSVTIKVQTHFVVGQFPEGAKCCHRLPSTDHHPDQRFRQTSRPSRQVVQFPLWEANSCMIQRPKRPTLKARMEESCLAHVQFTSSTCCCKSVVIAVA